MVGRELLKVDLRGRTLKLELVVRHGLGQPADIGFLFGIGDNHHLFNGGDLLQNIRDAFKRIELLSLKGISVGSEEDLGFDLTKTVQHALDAEIRGAGRPGGAQARGSQHGDNGLRHIGHEASHAISRLEPGSL